LVKYFCFVPWQAIQKRRLEFGSIFPFVTKHRVEKGLDQQTCTLSARPCHHHVLAAALHLLIELRSTHKNVLKYRARSTHNLTDSVKSEKRWQGLFGLVFP
jgi:hypothetical protein